MAALDTRRSVEQQLGVEISPIALSHIVQRAQHWGFLMLAVNPQAKPQGFAAYFVTTLSWTGNDNREIAHILAGADEADGDLQWNSVIHTGCERGDNFEEAVLRYLGRLGKMVGRESFSLLVETVGRKLWSKDALFQHYVGCAAGEVAYYGNPNQPFPMTRFLSPLDRVVKRCEEGNQFFGEHHKIVLHNLRQHRRAIQRGSLE